MDLTYADLPHYTCHKKVGALEIKEVGHYHPATRGSAEVVRDVTFANGSATVLPGDMFQRYTPVPGDFLVVYEDGYMSFSPRKAFIDGYTLTDDRTFADIRKEAKK